MRRNLSSLFLLLIVFVLLTAMGGKGGGFERVPRVEKNFSVTVTDITGNTIKGDKFSWEGRLRFSGSMGMAEVNVPFERISKVTIGDRRDQKRLVNVLLNDGSETSFDIDADSRCYGEADFGTFMLTINDIKTISFQNR